MSDGVQVTISHLMFETIRTNYSAKKIIKARYYGQMRVYLQDNQESNLADLCRRKTILILTYHISWVVTGNV